MKTTLVTKEGLFDEVRYGQRPDFIDKPCGFLGESSSGTGGAKALRPGDT